MNIQTLTELLNTIRDEGTAQYKNVVPEATQLNLKNIGGIFADEVDLANEFTSSLLNKFAKVVLHNKRFENPLAILKKGKKPLGDTIQEIYTNFAKAKGYDETGVDLLKRELPDVKAVYHKMNSKNKFKVTISPEMLSKAFNSYDNLNSFIGGIIDSLYNGAHLTEFATFKEMFGKAIEDGSMKIITIADPSESSENATKFIKTVKKVSGGMQFPSSNYNGYLNVQNTDIIPVTTFTLKDDQVILIDVNTNVDLDVDVLAKAFNISKQEFMARTIVIDAFPRSEMRAVVVDKEFFQVYDDLTKFTSWKNPEGIYDNYYYHVWQTFAYSCLVNSIAFCIGSDQDTDTNTIVDEFNVTYTLADGINVTNDRPTVIEGGTLLTTINAGEETIDTVTVTMAGVDVTSTVYNSDSGKVQLSDIDGNIVITVTTV